MNAVVNTEVIVPMLFLDDTGAGKTGLTVTAAARKAGTTTTVSGTVTERTGGEYDAAITLTSTGVWMFQGTTTIDGDAALWTETIQVVTAAQADPAAALASTVSAVTTLTERLTSARAAKLDRIGSDAQIVEAGTLTDGDRLDIRRGDSYLAADGNSKQWTYDGPAIASATLTLRTYAGVTALTKAVTLSGTMLTVADITAVETAALSLGTPIYRYEIVAALAGGGTSTLTSGTVWVQD